MKNQMEHIEQEVAESPYLGVLRFLRYLLFQFVCPVCRVQGYETKI